LRPISIYITGNSQLWGHIGYIPSDTYIILTSLFVSLGFAAFLIIPYLLGRELFENFQCTQPIVVITNPSALYITVFVLLSLGMYGIWAGYGIADSSEVLGYEVDVDAKGGQRLVGVSGYQTALAEFLPSLLLTLYFIFGLSRPILALFIAFVALRIWIGAGRNAFVLLAFGMVMIAIMRAGLRTIPLKFIAFGGALGYVFDIVGSDRLALRKLIDGGTTFSEILSNYQQSRGKEGLLSDVQEFDVTSTLISIIPDMTGYNWGSQYLRLLIWPIPRQIWENKPVYTSIIDLSAHGNFFGLTWTLNADLYSNFGIISLLMGMILVGYIAALTAKRLSQSSGFFPRASYWILMIYLPILYRDGPITYIYFTMFALIPPFLLSRFGTVKLAGEG
jgi:hypothetical protein